MQLIALFIYITSLAFGSEQVKLKTEINKFENVNNSHVLCVSCSQENFSGHADCPSNLKESYKNIYKRGTVGLINQIISDGSLKNPRTTCNQAADNVKSIKLKDLYKELQTKYPENRQLFEVTQKCNQAEEPDKTNFATTFMTYDFNYKTNSIQASMNELIDARAQIDSLLSNKNLEDKKQLDCKFMHLENVKRHCENLNNCPKNNQQELFDLQKNQISDALNTIQTIKQNSKDEVDKLVKGINSDKSDKIKKINELRDIAIENILDLNPLLRGNEFKKIVADSKYIKDDLIETSLKNQLVINKKEINQKINNFNKAYDCLTGVNKTGCDDMNETIRESKYEPNTADFIKNPNMQAISSFYNCVRTVSDARTESDKVVDGALIDAAVSLTPIAAVNVLKLAATSTRLAMSAANLAKVEGVINNTNTAITIGYNGHQNKEIYDQCKNNENAFEQLGAHQKNLKCENLQQVLVHKTLKSSCASDAIFSATLASVPLAMPTIFKAARSLANQNKNLIQSTLSLDQKNILEKAIANKSNVLKGNNEDALKAFGNATDEQRIAAARMIKSDATLVHDQAVIAAHNVGKYSAEEVAAIAKKNGSIGKFSSQEVKALAKDGRGITLTYGQLSEDLIEKKANILVGKEGPLKEAGLAGFNSQERQKLIRLGITGEGEASAGSKLSAAKNGSHPEIEDDLDLDFTFMAAPTKPVAAPRIVSSNNIVTNSKNLIDGAEVFIGEEIGRGSAGVIYKGSAPNTVVKIPLDTRNIADLHLEIKNAEKLKKAGISGVPILNMPENGKMPNFLIKPELKNMENLDAETVKVLGKYSEEQQRSLRSIYNKMKAFNLGKPDGEKLILDLNPANLYWDQAKKEFLVIEGAPPTAGPVVSKYWLNEENFNRRYFPENDFN